MAAAQSHAQSHSTEPSTTRFAEFAEKGSAKMAELKRAQAKANELAASGHSRGEIRAHLKQNMNLQNAVITVVVAGATAYAGLQVMSTIGGTLSLSQGDMFYNASQSLQDGISSFFTQLPTVFVVIALVLVIGYLTILR
jgi:hypothetical protein